MREVDGAPTAKAAWAVAASAEVVASVVPFGLFTNFLAPPTKVRCGVVPVVRQ